MKAWFYSEYKFFIRNNFVKLVTFCLPVNIVLKYMNKSIKKHSQGIVFSIIYFFF